MELSKRFAFTLIGALAALALLAAAAAYAHGGATTAAKRKTVVITTRKLPKLGYVLVDSKGRTLYMFVPDKHKRVTCKAVCAVVWPPLVLPAGATIKTTGKAKHSLTGSDADPAGGRVVTYDHWPLYTYVGDVAAGHAKGQALNVNGGLWFVLAPSGKVVRIKARP
jgi:predicted lipoprotein with Yx(FWY)xxD motif